MVILKRITDPSAEDFIKLKELYTEAFPLEERRDMEQLEALLQTEPAMYFNAVECDGELAGLFIYWDFTDFYYLEHLAVFAQMRNKKIGQQVLDWVREHLEGARLLEAEPEGTEIADRRIRYYMRNGYMVVDKNYLQPSYRKEGRGCALWVMTNDPAKPVSVLKSRLQTIKERVYSV